MSNNLKYNNFPGNFCETLTRLRILRVVRFVNKIYDLRENQDSSNVVKDLSKTIFFLQSSEVLYTEINEGNTNVSTMIKHFEYHQY